MTAADFDTPPSEPLDDSDVLVLSPGQADARSADRLREFSDGVVRRFEVEDDGTGPPVQLLPLAVREFISRATPDELCDLLAAGLAALDAHDDGRY